jgi:hypothetical protein
LRHALGEGQQLLAQHPRESLHVAQGDHVDDGLGRELDQGTAKRFRDEDLEGHRVGLTQVVEV